MNPGAVQRVVDSAGADVLGWRCTLDAGTFQEPLTLVARMRNRLSTSHGGGSTVRNADRPGGPEDVIDRPGQLVDSGAAYLGSSKIGYSPRVRGLRGAGSRSALPLRFSVIFEYGGLIP